VKNTFSITELSSQLGKVSERIEMLTSAISRSEMEGDAGMVEMYTAMRMDELEHAQQFMILLTEFIVEDSTPEENTDEGDASAFAEGELTDTKGDCDTDDEDEG